MQNTQEDLRESLLEMQSNQVDSRPLLEEGVDVDHVELPQTPPSTNEFTPEAKPNLEQQRNFALQLIFGLASLNGALWPWSIWEQRVKQTLDGSALCQANPDKCADFGSSVIFFLLVGLGPFFGPIVGPRLGSGAVPPYMFARYATALVVVGYLLGALAMYFKATWLLIVGFAIPCGIGAGIGFITTVLSLVQWYVVTGNSPGKGSGLQGACQGGMGVIFSQIQYWMLYSDIGNLRATTTTTTTAAAGASGGGKTQPTPDFASPSSLHTGDVFIIMAVITGLCALPSCFYLTLPPRPEGRGPPPRSKLAPGAITSTGTFWVFFVALIFGEVPGWALQSFIAPLVTENLQAPAYSSTCILTAFLAMFSIGRLSCGILGDKIGAIKVWQGATIIQAFCSFGVAMLFRNYQSDGSGDSESGTFAGILVLCALVGVCFSAVKVSVPGIIGKAWGSPLHVSPVMGMTGPAIALAVLAGALAIFYVTRSGTTSTSANPFFYACTAMSLASAALATHVPKPPEDTPGLRD
eukprot:g6598.t1